MYALTPYMVDRVFVVMVVLAIVVPLTYNEVRYRIHTRRERQAMVRAIHDYTYSATLVRMMDRKH